MARGPGQPCLAYQAYHCQERAKRFVWKELKAISYNARWKVISKIITWIIISKCFNPLSAALNMLLLGTYSGLEMRPFCQYDATPTKIIEGFDHWLSVSRNSMMTLFKLLWALGNQCIKSLTFKRSIIEHDQFLSKRETIVKKKGLWHEVRYVNIKIC